MLLDGVKRKVRSLLTIDRGDLDLRLTIVDGFAASDDSLPAPMPTDPYQDLLDRARRALERASDDRQRTLEDFQILEIVGGRGKEMYLRELCARDRAARGVPATNEAWPP